MKTKETLKERKYYKYNEVDWSQPTLTNNFIVQDNFSARGYYNLFYPNTGKAYYYRDEVRCWAEVYMYSPNGIIPKNFTFGIEYPDNTSSDPYNIKFYGTNQDWVMSTLIPFGATNETRNSINQGAWAAAWEVIGSSANNARSIDMSSNTKKYKWLRLELSTRGVAYDDSITLKNLCLYGKSIEIVEGTAEDYDFYRDEYKYEPLIKEMTYVESENYELGGFLRGCISIDTLSMTSKLTKKGGSVLTWSPNSLTKTSSLIGNLLSGTTFPASYAAVDPSLLFSPTGGTKRVRPLRAKFNCTKATKDSSTIVSSSGIQACAYEADGTCKQSQGTGDVAFETGEHSVAWDSLPFYPYWSFNVNAWNQTSGSASSPSYLNVTFTGNIYDVVWEVENEGYLIPVNHNYMLKTYKKGQYYGI